MGEMCDFEAEHMPWLWNFDYNTRGRKRGSKVVSLTLTAEQYQRFRALGGIRALKKVINAAPIPERVIAAKEAA